jgi:organic radical activating enzyme
LVLEDRKHAVVAERSFFVFLKSGRHVGRVAVTGGEPLLHRILPTAFRIKSLGYKVKLDTTAPS